MLLATSGHCEWFKHGEAQGAYLFDVILQDLGDRQAVVSVLAGDVGQRSNFDPRVHRQVFQGLTIVVSHFGGVICHDCCREKEESWSWRSEAEDQAQRGQALQLGTQTTTQADEQMGWMDL